MAHCRQTPKDHCQSVTNFGAQAVDESPHHNHSDGVRRLKREYQVSVVDLVPAESMLQRGFQDAEDLAVHVILGDA